MKALITAALILGWNALVGGQCVEVIAPGIPETKPSSRNAKITLQLDDKPQGNAKHTVSLPPQQGTRSLVTDSRGATLLKDLPLGISCIAATGENNLSAGLCLEVSAQSTTEVSSFQLTLAAPPPRVNSFDEKVKRMEQRPPALRFRTLAGIVLDPVGAVIPKAKIQIHKRGSYPGEPMKTLKTNELGRFSDSLKPGAYTVIVRVPGFRTEFQGIEISPDGKDDELRQVLQVQATDTCE